MAQDLTAAQDQNFRIVVIHSEAAGKVADDIQVDDMGLGSTGVGIEDTPTAGTYYFGAALYARHQIGDTFFDSPSTLERKCADIVSVKL